MMFHSQLTSKTNQAYLTSPSPSQKFINNNRKTKSVCSLSKQQKFRPQLSKAPLFQLSLPPKHYPINTNPPIKHPSKAKTYINTPNKTSNQPILKFEYLHFYISSPTIQNPNSTTKKRILFSNSLTLAPEPKKHKTKYRQTKIYI